MNKKQIQLVNLSLIANQISLINTTSKPSMHNTYKSKKTFKIAKKTYTFFSLRAAEKNGVKNISSLPFSIKILLENLLRNEDGKTVTKGDIESFSKWKAKKKISREINFSPARVLMQDFTGVPAVVDLASMRSAIHKLNGNPNKINPLTPVDLVIDHSVMVDKFGNKELLTMKNNLIKDYYPSKNEPQFSNFLMSSHDNISVKIFGNQIIDNIEIFKRMSLPAPLNLFKPAVNFAFRSSGIDPFYTRFASSFVLKIDENIQIDGTGVMEIMDLQ